MSKAGGAALVLSLPECLLGLLELLDAQGIAQLRRSACLSAGNDACSALAQAVRVTELRAAVLELLEITKFPFVHAAYVLGLNGPYYSVDTAADRHYGIPALLPRLLCRLLQLEKPGTAFTTLRIQKFAASANIGNHRTLPTNLHTPVAYPDEGEQQEPVRDEAPDTASAPAFVLCLTKGCQGGYGEISEDLQDQSCSRRWRRFAAPGSGVSAMRWSEFPMDTWLRWYWPSSGDFYAITVTCEPPDHLRLLQPRQRMQMLKLGFQLPRPWSEISEDDSEDYSEDVVSPCTSTASTGAGDEGAEGSAPRRLKRLSSARLSAAKRILGLTGLVAPSTEEIEESYRRSARKAHPDRANAAGSSRAQNGWDMAQLTWARTVLKEAASATAEGISLDGVEEEAAGPMLALPL
mmetsp:Transcript_38984/g.70368  ORF Transcript_38984/g.70368 Transcript_38984/m.70368 type:complete len:407 (-) Transcript_38984:65-1285(-)